jgi:hypothetical protein
MFGRRVARGCAAAALVMSAVAIVGAPGAGAAPEPTATLEVGSPGTVDFAFDPNGNEDVLPALVLLEAPATCPNPLTELPGSGYFAGGDPTVLAFTVESGDIVLDLGEPGGPGPLPDGLYQFCAYWLDVETDVGTLITELEAEIGSPAREPTTTTAAPTTTTTPATPVTPRYTG